MPKHSGWLAVLLISAAFADSDSTSVQLSCVVKGEKVFLMRAVDSFSLDSYTTLEACEETRTMARGGVVCVLFKPGMPIGPGGWDESGWRPTNIQTQMGLGRRPMSSRKECLDATLAAAGGVVCTNTGLGAKAANIDTNMWCGASSQLKYCLGATVAAVNHTVCSFPSSGTGVESGWVRTVVTGECEYQGQKMSLKDCNASIAG